LLIIAIVWLIEEKNRSNEGIQQKEA
jgi:hypothetical protein